jgi:hypothetical protein
MLWRGALRSALGIALVVVVTGCGGDSREEQDEADGAGHRAGRTFVAQLPRSQPPPITVTLRLRGDGVARIIYQIAGARSFRDERGRWTEAAGHIVLTFDASEHPEGPLPSPLSLRVDATELVAPEASLAEAEVRFVPHGKQR